jgi:hypothetical protein
MREGKSRNYPVYSLANTRYLSRYRLCVEGARLYSNLKRLFNVVTRPASSIGSDGVSSVNLDIRVEIDIHCQSSRCWDKRQVTRVPAHQLIHV